jgi:hypothetical protein
MKIDLEGFTIKEVFCDLKAGYVDTKAMTKIILRRSGRIYCRATHVRKRVEPHLWFRFLCPEDRTADSVLYIDSDALLVCRYHYVDVDEESELVLEAQGLPQDYTATIAKILKE